MLSCDGPGWGGPCTCFLKSISKLLSHTTYAAGSSRLCETAQLMTHTIMVLRPAAKPTASHLPHGLEFPARSHSKSRSISIKVGSRLLSCMKHCVCTMHEVDLLAPTWQG